MRRCPRWRLREKSPSKSCLGKRSRQPVCTMKCAWKKKRWSTADPSGKLAAKITAATSPPTALSPATRSKDQVAKNSPVSRKLPNRKSASRIPMHPRRRILLPPTTPRGTIHRASETIAGRGRDRGGDRGGDHGRGRGRGGRWGRRRGGSGGGDRDRGGRHHGPGGRNLPPSKYASPQGERDSRGFDSRRPNDRGPVDRGPSAPVERRDDDIVLPGESLAKYRGRPVPTPVEPLGDHEPEERQPDFTEQQGRPAVGMQPNSGVPRRFSGSLPHWVLADTETEGEAAGGGEAQPEEVAAAAETTEQETARAEEQHEEHHEEAHAEAHHSETSGLSEEE